MRSEDVNFIVVRSLCNYGYKWKEIGLALGFLNEELEGILYSDPRAKVQQLLVEVLSQWSQWPTASHSDVPTMERLRDALRSGLVGLGAVANDLYELRHSLPSKKQ